MAEPKSPIICLTYQRPFPHGLKREDTPQYFAQHRTFTTEDDVAGVGTEVTMLLNYIQSVAYVTRFADEVPEDHYLTILELLMALGKEAERRQDFVMRNLKTSLERQREGRE
jgi:hypothetical protein